MSKTSLCIELLKILYSYNRTVGVKELADILEVNERNIPEYIRELRNIGYDIKTIAGRYGGYLLQRYSTFPSIKLTESELNGLIAGYEYLSERNDFLELKPFSMAMSKICSSVMNKNSTHNPTLIVNRFPLKMGQEELVKRYSVINECIIEKKCLQVEYLSLDNKVSERVIHPYKLYMYNNSWFVLGYDESVNEIRYFKINRINNFEKLNKKFSVLRSYNESDYLDEYGMKNNGEWYPIRIKLSGTYAMLIKERKYGKEQKIEEFEDYTILSCKMQNKENIKHFVLGFGEYCEVLEPEWLKEEILTTCNELVYNNCKKDSCLNLLKMVPNEKIRTIAVDFDGTLCERKKFPEIGEPKRELIEWLKEQRENGKKVILWTCRENENLESAVKWCRMQGLEFDSVNKNPESINIKTTKVIADVYIDDRACVPLKRNKKS